MSDSRREFLKNMSFGAAALGVGVGTGASEASAEMVQLDVQELNNENSDDKVMERHTMPHFHEEIEVITHVDPEYICLAPIIKNYVLGNPRGLDVMSFSEGGIDRLYRDNIRHIFHSIVSRCDNIITLKKEHHDPGQITLAIPADELVLKRLHQYGYFTEEKNNV